jgi:hypothetical protein
MADDEDEIEQVWQRVRAYAQQLLDENRPIRTPAEGVVNHITEVKEKSIRKRSEKPKSEKKSSPVTRWHVAGLWRSATTGDGRVPQGFPSLGVALMEGAIEEFSVDTSRPMRVKVDRTRPTPSEGTIGPVTATTIVGRAPRVDTFSVGPTEAREASNREAQLVAAYQAHLAAVGIETAIRQYNRCLECDVFVQVRGHLIEAKADTSRESIRMAIGQLYDYDLLEKLAGEFPALDLAVLLPERPSSDMLRLLDARGMTCVWQVADGFEDTHGGKFS